MRVGDVDAAGLRGQALRAYRRTMQMVYQDPYDSLDPRMNVLQAIGEALSVRGLARAQHRAQASGLLERVNLPASLLSRYPAQLSGGQRQRVGVARALAGDPPLMLMDEPFGAIDPINRSRLQDEFLRLQERLRKTVVFVTHDIDEAIKMGDRIAILREGGTLAQYDAPPDLLMRPADEFVAKFVGADRALKRLGLATLESVELADAGAVDVGDRRIPVSCTVRDALSQVLAAGGVPLAVTDGPDVVGAVTLELLGGVLKDGALGETSSEEKALS
jgi:osmoprotectant transport system ATP-binding protein